MGERRPGDHVADRPDALLRGAQAAVDLHEAVLVALDAGLVEAQALHVGAPAGGDHEIVEAAVSPLKRTLTAVSEASTPSTAAPVSMRTFCLRISRAQAFAASAVLERQDLVERLEQQHLGAEPPEGRGDLGPRGAGADHAEALRLLVQEPHRGGVEHPPAELEIEDRLRHRAAGEHDVVGLDLRTVEGRANSHVGFVGQRAKPSISSIPCLSNRPATPPVSVFTTLVAALRRPGVVERCALDADSKVLGVAHLVEDLSHAQDRLGGDAGLVQAAPAQSPFSTTAVLIPSCAARIAATYPPGPEPITTQSYLRSGIAAGA